jgi:signal transduction histidine kinase
MGYSDQPRTTSTFPSPPVLTSHESRRPRASVAVTSDRAGDVGLDPHATLNTLLAVAHAVAEDGKLPPPSRRRIVESVRRTADALEKLTAATFSMPPGAGTMRPPWGTPEVPAFTVLPPAHDDWDVRGLQEEILDSLVKDSRRALAQLQRRVYATRARSTELRSALDECRVNGGEAFRRIANMLDVATAEHDGLVCRRAPVEVITLLENAVRDHHAEAQYRSVELLWECDVGVVRADPARLARVVDVLVAHAVQFTPDGGGVTVQATERDHVEITLTHDGLDPLDDDRSVEIRFCRAAIAAEGGSLVLGADEHGRSAIRIRLPSATRTLLPMTRGSKPTPSA